MIEYIKSLLKPNPLLDYKIWKNQCRQIESHMSTRLKIMSEDELSLFFNELCKIITENKDNESPEEISNRVLYLKIHHHFTHSPILFCTEQYDKYYSTSIIFLLKVMLKSIKMFVDESHAVEFSFSRPLHFLEKFLEEEKRKEREAEKETETQKEKETEKEKEIETEKEIDTEKETEKETEEEAETETEKKETNANVVFKKQIETGKETISNLAEKQNLNKGIRTEICDKGDANNNDVDFLINRNTKQKNSDSLMFETESGPKNLWPNIIWILKSCKKYVPDKILKIIHLHWKSLLKIALNIEGELLHLMVETITFYIDYEGIPLLPNSSFLNDKIFGFENASQIYTISALLLSHLQYEDFYEVSTLFSIIFDFFHNMDGEEEDIIFFDEKNKNNDIIIQKEVLILTGINEINKIDENQQIYVFENLDPDFVRSIESFVKLLVKINYRDFNINSFFIFLIKHPTNCLNIFVKKYYNEINFSFAFKEIRRLFNNLHIVCSPQFCRFKFLKNVLKYSSMKKNKSHHWIKEQNLVLTINHSGELCHHCIKLLKKEKESSIFLDNGNFKDKIFSLFKNNKNDENILKFIFRLNKLRQFNIQINFEDNFFNDNLNEQNDNLNEQNDNPNISNLFYFNSSELSPYFYLKALKIFVINSDIRNEKLLLFILQQETKEYRIKAVEMLTPTLSLSTNSLFYSFLYDSSFEVRNKIFGIIPSFFILNPLYEHPSIKSYLDYIISALTFKFKNDNEIIQKIAGNTKQFGLHFNTLKMGSYSNVLIETILVFLTERYPFDNKAEMFLDNASFTSTSLSVNKSRKNRISLKEQIIRSINEPILLKRDKDFLKTLSNLGQYCEPYLETILNVFNSIFKIEKNEKFLVSAIKSLINLCLRMKGGLNLSILCPEVQIALLHILKSTKQMDLKIIILQLLGCAFDSIIKPNNEYNNKGNTPLSKNPSNSNTINCTECSNCCPMKGKSPNNNSNQNDEKDNNCCSNIIDTIMETLLSADFESGHWNDLKVLAVIFESNPIYSSKFATDFARKIILFIKAVRSNIPDILYRCLSVVVIKCPEELLPLTNEFIAMLELRINDLNCVKMCFSLVQFLPKDFSSLFENISYMLIERISLFDHKYFKWSIRFLAIAIVDSYFSIDLFLYRLSKIEKLNIIEVLNSLEFLVQKIEIPNYIVHVISIAKSLFIDPKNSSIIQKKGKICLDNLYKSIFVFQDFNISSIMPSFCKPQNNFQNINNNINENINENNKDGQNETIKESDIKIITYKPKFKSFIKDYIKPKTFFLDNFSIFKDECENEKMVEFITNLIVFSFKNSPEAIFRAFSEFVFSIPSLTHRLFPAAFLSIWKICGSSDRSHFSSILRSIFSANLNSSWSISHMSRIPSNLNELNSEKNLGNNELHSNNTFSPLKSSNDHSYNSFNSFSKNRDSSSINSISSSNLTNTSSSNNSELYNRNNSFNLYFYDLMNLIEYMDSHNYLFDIDYLIIAQKTPSYYYSLIIIQRYCIKYRNIPTSIFSRLFDISKKLNKKANLGALFKHFEDRIDPIVCANVQNYLGNYDKALEIYQREESPLHVRLRCLFSLRKYDEIVDYFNQIDNIDNYFENQNDKLISMSIFLWVFAIRRENTRMSEILDNHKFLKKGSLLLPQIIFNITTHNYSKARELIKLTFKNLYKYDFEKSDDFSSSKKLSKLQLLSEFSEIIDIKTSKNDSPIKINEIWDRRVKDFERDDWLWERLILAKSLLKPLNSNQVFYLPIIRELRKSSHFELIHHYFDKTLDNICQFDVFNEKLKIQWNEGLINEAFFGISTIIGIGLIRNIKEFIYLIAYKRLPLPATFLSEFAKNSPLFGSDLRDYIADYFESVSFENAIHIFQEQKIDRQQNFFCHLTLKFPEQMFNLFTVNFGLQVQANFPHLCQMAGKFASEFNTEISYQFYNVARQINESLIFKDNSTKSFSFNEILNNINLNNNINNCNCNGNSSNIFNCDNGDGKYCKQNDLLLNNYHKTRKRMISNWKGWAMVNLSLFLDSNDQKLNNFHTELAENQNQKEEFLSLDSESYGNDDSFGDLDNEEDEEDFNENNGKEEEDSENEEGNEINNQNFYPKYSSIISPNCSNFNYNNNNSNNNYNNHNNNNNFQSKYGEVEVESASSSDDDASYFGSKETNDDKIEHNETSSSYDEIPIDQIPHIKIKRSSIESQIRFSDPIKNSLRFRSQFSISKLTINEISNENYNTIRSKENNDVSYKDENIDLNNGGDVKSINIIESILNGEAEEVGKQILIQNHENQSNLDQEIPEKDRENVNSLRYLFETCVTPQDFDTNYGNSCSSSYKFACDLIDTCLKIVENEEKFSFEFLVQLFFALFSLTNSNEGIPKTFEERVLNLPPRLLIEMLPQISIHINSCLPFVEKLYIAASREDLQSVFFSLNFQCQDKNIINNANNNNNDNNSFASEILNKMKSSQILKNQTLLFDECTLFDEGLNILSQSVFEKWKSAIETAPQSFFNCDIIMAKRFNEFSNPKSDLELLFNEKFGKTIKECEALFKIHSPESLSKMWNLLNDFYNNELNDFLVNQFYSTTLKQASSKLSNHEFHRLKIPGSSPKSSNYNVGNNFNHNMDKNNDYYFGSSSPEKLKYISEKVDILQSLQKPRCIEFVSTSGEKYKFLLKANEDLRVDQRIMQFFNLVNSFLNKTFKRENMEIVCYKIIPLRKDCGLISYVKCSESFHQIVEDARKNNNESVFSNLNENEADIECNIENENKNIPLNYEKVLNNEFMDEITYENLNRLQKYEFFKYVDSKTSGIELFSTFFHRSISSSDCVSKLNTFTKSLAVMSMVGHVIGLGDRHPSNILIDTETGVVIHIDFGDCFESSQKRKIFPEKVPFRLTRMLVNALEGNRSEGHFNEMCIKVMKLMRKKKASLAAQLAVFLKESQRDKSSIDRVIQKLSGKEFFAAGKESSDKTNECSINEALNVEEQVKKLIRDAENPFNYCQHFPGWCPFW